MRAQIIIKKNKKFSETGIISKNFRSKNCFICTQIFNFNTIKTSLNFQFKVDLGL